MLDVLRDRVGGGRRNLPDLGRLRGYAAVRLGLRFSYSAGEVGSADLVIGGYVRIAKQGDVPSAVETGVAAVG